MPSTAANDVIAAIAEALASGTGRIQITVYPSLPTEICVQQVNRDDVEAYLAVEAGRELLGFAVRTLRGRTA